MSDNAVKLMRNDIANHGCVMGIAASAAIDRIEELDKTIEQLQAIVNHVMFSGCLSGSRECISFHQEQDYATQYQCDRCREMRGLRHLC